MLSGANAVLTNEAFWAQAYADNFSRLCSRANRRLTAGNFAEAEDTVSEAFVRVMKYRPDPGAIKNVGSYLWTTVKRVWASQQVRLRTSRTQHLEDMNTDEIESLAAVQIAPEILTLLDQEEIRNQFRLRLGPLSLREETLVDLRRQEYSFEEIAAQLNEDVKFTRFRWNKLIARQRRRIVNQKIELR